MSLLPETIIPETVDIGTVQPDGKVKINHTWWLLLYNIVQNSIAPTTGQDFIENAVFMPRQEAGSLALDAGNLLQIFADAPRQTVAVLGNSQDILQQRIFGR